MIFDASQGNEAALQSLNSRLRQFHDKLGFKAKESLKQGGLCAGAIFRTQRFIATQERSGAKKGPEKTVHIEHTVPVAVLASSRDQKTAVRKLRGDARVASQTLCRDGTAPKRGAAIARQGERHRCPEPYVLRIHEAIYEI
jgi:hypothetical protein